ncbi:MAG: metallo-beta-lactamase class [Frankiaceae bacterium]|nr:metallo-beta-lactamase class [Frankiaceae bacterium]
MVAVPLPGHRARGQSSAARLTRGHRNGPAQSTRDTLPSDAEARRPCPPAALGSPVHLTEHLVQVAGPGITHEWDAAAYLLLGDHPTLLDCGSAAGYPALSGHLNALGVAPARLRRVLATHGHWDHVSGMARIQAQADTEFALHAADRFAVESGDALLTAAAPLYGEVFPPVRVDTELHDGQHWADARWTVDVLHTPGHTPGSVSFVVAIDGRRILVAGDTLWGGFSVDGGSNLADWRVSLDRLCGLEIDALTFGHGVRRLVPDATERLLEARRRFGVLLDPWHKPEYLDFRY